MRYDFDGHVLDTERVELRRGTKLVEMEPQVFDLLLFLIQNQDRVISSDELFDVVWQGRIVSLSTLTSRINAARKAIGDSGAEQKLIKTIPRKGYRFTGQATSVAAEEQAAEPQPESDAPPGDTILHLGQWRAHRLCQGGQRPAAGEGRQLAEPS